MKKLQSLIVFILLTFSISTYSMNGPGEGGTSGGSFLTVDSLINGETVILTDSTEIKWKDIIDVQLFDGTIMRAEELTPTFDIFKAKDILLNSGDVILPSDISIKEFILKNSELKQEPLTVEKISIEQIELMQNIWRIQ